MNRRYNKISAKIIREKFNDKRKIECPVSAEELQIDKDVHPGGDIFKTEDGDFIDLELQESDFDEEELVKYVELAEDIYEKHHKAVSIYIICPDNIDVRVREFTIKSEAEFTIKLAKVEENPAEDILNHIKSKIMKGEILNEDDIDALENSPMIYKRKERHDHRVEVFKILNRILH